MKLKQIQKFYREFDLEKHAGKRGMTELPLIIRLLKGKKRILDLACGYGRISIPLSKRGFEMQGVDIAKNLLEKARKNARKAKTKIDFKWGHFLKIPFKKEYFDAIIVIWSSFCHLLNEKEQIMALKEMKRVLSDKGIIIIDLPYYKKTPGIEIFEKNGKKTELFKFNKEWLKKIAKKAKLKIKIMTIIKKDRKRNWVILKK